MTPPRRRVRAVVSGLVQGVSFRRATEQAARGLGLAGWVRNLPDGRVELAAEGAPDAVERLLAFVRRGPPAARVTGVDVSDEPPEGAAPPFEVRPTPR